MECKSLTIKLANEIEKIGPFGVGNLKPKIVLRNVLINKSDVVGKNKDCIRLIISDKNGIKSSKSLIAMCFRVKRDDKIFSVLTKGNIVNLLGELTINRWNNQETVQFVVEDVLCN
jgi:single-stranded-DNA-specific exonuclease